MGAEQAATVMTIIKREQLKRTGKTLTEDDAEKIAAPIRAQYETEGHPYFGTARLWDDGIIDPIDTRWTVATAFAAAAQAPLSEPRRPVFRM
jgi:acetyl-CoA carboxylase carboxyltransferase component